MKRKIKLLIPLITVTLAVAGCSFSGGDAKPEDDGTGNGLFADIEGNTETGSEDNNDGEIVGNEEIPPIEEWKVTSYSLKNGVPTVEYQVFGITKTLVPDIYYEPEWSQYDGYVLGDTDLDGRMEDDYLVCDIDDDGIDELMVGTVVAGNTLFENYSSFVIYEMDDFGDLVKTDNPACMDVTGCAPRIENNRFVVTQYEYNGEDYYGISYYIGYIEGEFTDEDIFGNYVRIRWNEEYTQANVIISIYRQMGFEAVGYMDNGVLKFTCINNEDAGDDLSGITGEFYMSDSGLYNLVFHDMVYDYVLNEEPYEDFYRMEPTVEETSAASHLTVNVYSNESYVREGSVVIVGTVSEVYGESPYSEGDEIEMYFCEDTVLDDPQSLDHGKAGDTALMWLGRLSGDETSVGLMGVYDIMITDGHVDKVIGLYWWD